MQLVFGSTNEHKRKEIEHLLPAHITLLSLRDIAFSLPLPEPYFTMEENALSKLSFLSSHIPFACFTEDSGLEVEALDGRPGALSARFAGDTATMHENITLLLHTMKHVSNRRACFTSVIAYCDANRQTHIFKGQVHGSIADNQAGEGGFGYDPVFIPSGFSQTFAQLPKEIKQACSHRTKAFESFLSHLKMGK